MFNYQILNSSLNIFFLSLFEEVTIAPIVTASRYRDIALIEKRLRSVIQENELILNE